MGGHANNPKETIKPERNETMPMLNTQILAADKTRGQFIEQLSAYIELLREELRTNELILASVVSSLSEQSETTRKLGQELERRRNEQRPLIRSVQPMPGQPA
jgi:hypothetical protein